MGRKGQKAEGMAIKAADMLIARRADTRARADFATWKMMAKLNGASSLPAEAQTFLESYKTLLKEMTEAPASFRKTLRGRVVDRGGRLDVRLPRAVDEVDTDIPLVLDSLERLRDTA